MIRILAHLLGNALLTFLLHPAAALLMFGVGKAWREWAGEEGRESWDIIAVDLGGVALGFAAGVAVRGIP